MTLVIPCPLGQEFDTNIKEMGCFKWETVLGDSWKRSKYQDFKKIKALFQKMQNIICKTNEKPIIDFTTSEGSSITSIE